MALVLATARFLASRLDSIRVDNTAAHAAITENVKENQRQIGSLGAKVDAITENVKENQRQGASLGAKVDAIAVDVAYLRGRQEETAVGVAYLRGRQEERDRTATG